MTGAITRRAALGSMASVPALALPAFAAASTTLSDLIKAFVEAKAEFYVQIDALEASEPDSKMPFELLGADSLRVGCSPERLHEAIDVIFSVESKKLGLLEIFAPDLAKAAKLRFEQEKALHHARAEEIFADYRAAEERYSLASEAEEDALQAVCAHRCGSFEELAVKGRFLLSHCERDEITGDQQIALLESMLPEGEIET